MDKSFVGFRDRKIRWTEAREGGREGSKEGLSVEIIATNKLT